MLFYFYSKLEKPLFEYDPGTSRALLDLVTSLEVCTSLLYPLIRNRLHPFYVKFHDRVLQFYLVEFSIKLELPFPLANISITLTR